MEEYYFSLVGLRVVLRTPCPITISDNLRPFLCAPHHTADCIISLEASQPLPGFSECGLWHGPEYYDCHQGTMRIFHCTAPHTAAFAVTQLLKSGNIRLCVLPAYLSYFAGTAGIFNRIGMETLLLQHQGLLLHASLIDYHGKAITFSGPSGAGKSTQADIWAKSQGARILNGDRAALRMTADGWNAYGSPYAGTSGIYHDLHAPLAAIVVLEKAKKNHLQRLSPTEAFRLLYPELSLHRWDPVFVAKATDLCLQLVDSIPVYRLQCLPEESAALVLKRGLQL